jgi:hypothetical protein
MIATKKPEIQTTPADKTRIEDASALPAQLGGRLRKMFAEAETQPAPERLVELMAALAAKERGEG